MFWIKKLKSEEYIELDERIRKLNTMIKTLEIDLDLFVHKLKASKGLKKEEEKETRKDLYAGMFLPDE